MVEEKVIHELGIQAEFQGVAVGGQSGDGNLVGGGEVEAFSAGGGEVIGSLGASVESRKTQMMVGGRKRDVVGHGEGMELIPAFASGKLP